MVATADFWQTSPPQWWQISGTPPRPSACSIFQNPGKTSVVAVLHPMETLKKMSPRSAYYSRLYRLKGKYTTKRLVCSMEKLKIKKEQKEFSTLQFDALPNEVIVHVFSYLRMVDLLNCGEVSKRFRAISYDLQKSASWISSKFTGQWMLFDMELN